MIYVNKIRLLNLREHTDGKDILSKYRNNFEIIKNFIDSIIISLMENISTIPYTLRCICKLINILICKKVNNVKIILKVSSN
jgi:hypothetical protein